MTDTPTTDADIAASESLNDSTSTPSSGKPKSTRKTSLWVAGLLLFLLALMAGAGYLGFGLWQQQQQDLRKLHGDVAALKQNLNDTLAKQLSSSQATFERLSQDTKATQQSLQRALAGLQATLDEHKQKLARLESQLGQNASQWRLSEIERLLAAAQLRVGALDDPLGARQMLREVERLAASLGGEAQAFRTAVQQLASALDTSVPLDRDGMALKMFNLAQMMPNLPLKAGEVAGFATDSSTGSPSGATQQASWWTQTKAWFGSWVTVKNTAQPATIAPIAERPAPVVDVAPAPLQARAERPAPLAETVQTLLQARAALLARHVDEAARLSTQALTQFSAQEQASSALDSSSPKVRQALAELREIAGALEQSYRPQVLDFAPAFVALRTLSQPTAAPESAPEAVPDAAPKVAPEAAPEAVPEVAPEVAPEARTSEPAPTDSTPVQTKE